MTYSVRAAEHVKYEYFILDLVIHRDTLLHIIFEFQLCVYIFCDDSQMTWIIVYICVKYVYLLSLSCLKKYYVFFKQYNRHTVNSWLTVNRDNNEVLKRYCQTIYNSVRIFSLSIRLINTIGIWHSFCCFR